MPTRLLLSTAAVALLLAAPMASAQTMQNRTQMPQAAATPSKSLSKPDEHFMKEAAIGGMFEVEMGKIAQQNAQSDEVKQFGARMVSDHGQANQKLQSLASQKGVDLPQQLDAKHQRQLEQMSKKQGAAFDHAYMANMVKDHNEDVKAFRHEAKNAKDPDLKQFASTTLDVIEQHDKLAKNVDHSLTATGSSRSSR